MKRMKKIIAVLLSLALTMPVTTVPVAAGTTITEPTEHVFNLSKIKSVILEDEGYWVTDINDLAHGGNPCDKYVFTGEYKAESNAPIVIKNNQGKTLTYNIEFRDAKINLSEQRCIIFGNGTSTVNLTATGENKLVSGEVVFSVNDNHELKINLEVLPGRGISGKENSMSYVAPVVGGNIYDRNVLVNLNKTAENAGFVKQGETYNKTVTYLPATENYTQEKGTTHSYVNSKGETVTEPCKGTYFTGSDEKSKHNLICRCGRIFETESHEKYIHSFPDKKSITSHTKWCTKCGEIVEKSEACTPGKKPVYYDPGRHRYCCSECDRSFSLEECIRGDEAKSVDEKEHIYKCKKCGEYSLKEEHIPSEKIILTKKPTETEWGFAKTVCKICGKEMTGIPVVPTGVYYFDEAEHSNDNIYRIYKNDQCTVFRVIKERHPVTGKAGIEVKAKPEDNIVLNVVSANNTEKNQGIRVYEPGSVLPVFEKTDMTGVKPHTVIWSNKKTADYTELEEVLDKIPEKLDRYEKNGVEALLEEVNKVIPYTGNQQEVENWEENILDALDNLQLQEQKKEDNPAEIRIENGDTLVISKEGYKMNSGKITPWKDSYKLTTKGTETDASVVVESGVHNITVSDLKIKKLNEGNPFCIKGGSIVNLDLEGENYLEEEISEKMEGSAALRVMKNAVLNISGKGELYASSADDGAGIGSDASEGTGTINIYSGKIDAASKDCGAGIGSGEYGTGGIIRIYGGNITATSADSGAGIGGGDFADIEKITIYGGNIKAVANDGAGIGGGFKGPAGNIIIHDGTIDASSEYGAGIGVGKYGKNGTVKIHGGIVNAVSCGKPGDNDSNAAGIGGSENTTVDLIEITGGKITANAEDGAGIGGGDDSNGGRIRISGGIIRAISKYGCAIGGGRGEIAGDILIRGGTFYIQGENIDLGGDYISMPGPDNVVVIEGGSFYELNGNIYNRDRISPSPMATEGHPVFNTVLDIKNKDGGPVEDGPAYIELTDGKKHYVTTVKGQTAMYLDENVAIKSVLNVNTPADFTALDKAANKIPADLSRYTDASVDKVNAILDRIDRKATVKDQNQIDFLAMELDYAVEDLRVKTSLRKEITDFTLSSSFEKSSEDVFKYRSRGKHVNADPIVKDKDGKTLEKDRDYTVTYSKDKRVAPGKYSIAVKGKGNYSGTVTKYLIITPEAVDDVSVRPTTASGGYDDAYITWEKSPGASGYMVYARRPSKTSEWTNIGRTTDNHLLKKDLYDGYKYEFKVLPYYYTDGLRYITRTGYETVSMITLKKPVLNSVKKYSSERVILTWKDISGESGYQVRASRSGKTTYFRTSATSMKLNVAKNKNYSYKIRPYKNIKKGGEVIRVYGPWSDSKTYTLK